MRVGAVQWQIRPGNFESFTSHLFEIVQRAALLRVELLVLPELPILEALDDHTWQQESEVPVFLSSYASEAEAQLQSLAKQMGITIVGGSFFVEKDGRFENRCLVCTADGSVSRYSKNRLTKWEREEWNLQPGQFLSPPFGNPKSGVLVCYDSEFPEAARLLCNSGATTLCVPAYTESQAGFQRVRWSCLARAIENQIFVAHASVVGGIGREPIVNAIGTAAIIAPSIEPFPEHAILAETSGNGDEVAVADLDFGALDTARQRGDVRNWEDRSVRPWRFETDAPRRDV